MNRTVNLRRMTVTAMFAAVATVVMFFEMPLPFMPPFLKLDLSSVPILIGSFILGPISGIAMAFIKSFVHFFSTTTGGVGEIADFIMTASFAVTAGAIYRKDHTKKGAITACLAGTFSITVAGVLANKFLLIPFFSTIMPMDAIFSACRAVNPIITDLNSYLMFGVVPFNIVKGLVVTCLTFPVYKKMSYHIKSFIQKIDPKAAAISVK